MRNLNCILFIFLSFSAWSQQVNIIPRPVQMAFGKGNFILSKKTVLAARDEEDRQAASLFNDYLQQVYGFKLDIDRQETKNYIRLNTKKFIKAPEKDGYSLEVKNDGITITGDTYAGTFYGLQTLIQLLPTTVSAKNQYAIPRVNIADYPAFAYRGMHLDVCRHFFPVSFVKKYIDFIALHKMNYFHWHLTDDQGWRIEIKKYPGLTEKGAWRNGTITGRYPGTGNDNTRYGGFYTQDEVRDIVHYAALRHITVIPEIEMPGHSSAAIASYPWLSCFPNEPTVIPSHPSETSKKQGGKLVQETWGVFEDVYCAGNDSTFLFLQDVMDEVLELFPSHYIHVGGDECPKNNWKRCPRCQTRMKAEGLKDEHELQSYFIQRMEKYLNEKGRILIGWDEILEGGLAPNAMVMSWRGEEGGIAAARQHHQVIMTPGGYVYFDYSQTKNEDSLVIGGYTPLEKVYGYNPVPKELSDTERKMILGAQANVWTEYMAYPSKVEYMIFPRMSALAEVLWSPEKDRSWTDFTRRLQTQFKRYELWKSSYSKAYFDLKTNIVPGKNGQGLRWSLARTIKDGSMVYKTPAGKTIVLLADSTSIAVDQPGMYSAWLINLPPGKSYEGPLSKYKQLTNPVKQTFVFSKSTGKKVSIQIPPAPKYPGQGGAFSLVNGVYSNKGLSFPDWLGWVGDDMIADIDLGKVQQIDSVRIHTLDQNGSWVYLPTDVEVLVSDDGVAYRPAGHAASFRNDVMTMGWINVSFAPVRTRYLRVIAENYGMIPQGKPGAGNKAWMMVDEIQAY